MNGGCINMVETNNKRSQHYSTHKNVRDKSCKHNFTSVVHKLLLTMPYAIFPHNA